MLFGNAPSGSGCAGIMCLGTLPEHLVRQRNAVQAIAPSISKGAFVSSHFENFKDAARHERAISVLTERTGASRAVVGALFAEEFARLARGATVRSYLVTRTASNVLAALREKPTRSTQ